MTPACVLTPEVLARALERAAQRNRQGVATRAYGAWHAAAPHEIRAFACAVLSELDALDREAIPEVAGDAATEPSVPPRDVPPRDVPPRVPAPREQRRTRPRIRGH